MNVETMLTLKDLKEQFSKYQEPYNLPDAPHKLDLLRAGEVMSGSPDLFRDWFKTTFGRTVSQIPRDMVDKIKVWMQSLTIVTGPTLAEWSKLGRAKFADFDTRQMGIVFGATKTRTRFPSLMTEEEAVSMIAQWRPTPQPTFLDLERVPQPLYPVALLPAITVTPVVYGCAVPFIQVPVEIDNAPAFAGDDNRTRHIAVRVNEPVITVAVHEVAIPFKDTQNRAAVGDAMGWSTEDYVRPLYTVGKGIVAKPKPRYTTRHQLRREISARENAMSLPAVITRRGDFFGQGKQDLNKASLDQLRDYARAVGVTETVVNAIMADHAKAQLGDGSSRRLAS